MPKRSKAEVLGVSYWYRDPHGWYADFRRAGGSGRKSLGISDPDAPEREVQQAVREHLDVLEGKRSVVGDGGATDPELRAYAQHYLDQRQDLSDTSRTQYNIRLSHFIRYFGPKTRLSDVGVSEINRYVRHRRQKVSERTVLGELHTLSALYSFAVSENAAGMNPVDHMAVKPSPDEPEPEWLEIGEAARLIDAALLMQDDPARRVAPHFGELVATMLLAGTRVHEATGLLGEDFDFENEVVHVRPNRYRELKTKRSRRTVPFWPQLREIMWSSDHIKTVVNERSHDLAFPGHSGEPLVNISRGFGKALELAEVERHVTPKACRHTYATTRLQTLDHGEPVSPYTVARELGHSGLRMIEKHYGHLQTRRVRLPEVRYEEADVTPVTKAREGTSG